MNKKILDRRDFLRKASVVGSVVAGGSLFAGCGGKNQGAANAGNPCADLSGLTDQDRSIRTTLQYVDVSEVEAACGACTLFKGPVAPKGYCVSWAAKPA